jgi:hypothetical protein
VQGNNVADAESEDSMRDAIDMAREAGFNLNFRITGSNEALDRLVDLVRADEQKKYKWDIHSCGPTCKRYACVAMREAVEAEREACSELVYNSPPSDEYESPLKAVYDAIRNRGNK